VLALLNKLLESERAGARGAREMSVLADSAQARTALRDVAQDEARFCAMLFGHITRLGETPSRRTGGFHEKLAALPALDDRLELLNRGQGWVVHKLREAVPKIAEDPLRADLEEMLAAHQRNIERCTQLIEPSSSPA
jgi:nitronate monooxygenase